MARILLADDDRSLTRLVSAALEEEGHMVTVCYTAADTLKEILRHGYDLCIIDWMFEGEKTTGIELVTAVRAHQKDAWVLMLSGKGTLMDRVQGVNAGADDYIAKPFYLPELLAKVFTKLRRSTPSENVPTEIVAGIFTLHTGRCEVRVHGEALHFKPKEYLVMMYLIRNPDRIVSRTELLDAVWGDHEAKTMSNTVDVHIGRIRKVLGEYAHHLVTRAGMGYMLITAAVA